MSESDSSARARTQGYLGGSPPVEAYSSPGVMQEYRNAKAHHDAQQTTLERIKNAPPNNATPTERMIGWIVIIGLFTIPSITGAMVQSAAAVVLQLIALCLLAVPAAIGTWRHDGGSGWATLVARFAFRLLRTMISVAALIIGVYAGGVVGFSVGFLLNPPVAVAPERIQLWSTIGGLASISVFLCGWVAWSSAVWRRRRGWLFGLAAALLAVLVGMQLDSEMVLREVGLMERDFGLTD